MYVGEVVVEIPSEDAEEFHTYLAIEAADVAVGHGLDGNDVARVVIALSGGSIALLRSWLLARVKRQQSATVVFQGRRLTGYTADEVLAIVKAISEDSSDRELGGAGTDSTAGSELPA